MLPISRSDLWMLAKCPARRAGSAPQGRSPVRAWPGVAERSGAALIQYGIIRQRVTNAVTNAPTRQRAGHRPRPGLFVPKSSCDADYQRYSMSDLESTVHSAESHTRMALSSAARRLTRSACHRVRQHDRGDSLVEHLQFLHRWVIRVCEPEDPTSPPHRILGSLARVKGQR